jgi:hypothetical protein
MCPLWHTYARGPFLEIWAITEFSSVITHKSFHVTLSDQRERHLHRTAFGAVQVRVSCSGNFILENGDSSVASLPQNDILGDVGNHQNFPT